MTTVDEINHAELDARWRRRAQGNLRTARAAVLLVVLVMSSQAIMVSRFTYSSNAHGEVRLLWNAFELSGSVVVLPSLVDGLLLGAIVFRWSRVRRACRESAGQGEDIEKLSPKESAILSPVLDDLAHRLGFDCSNVRLRVRPSDLTKNASVASAGSQDYLVVTPWVIALLLSQDPTAGKALVAHELSHLKFRHSRIWLSASVWSGVLLHIWLPVRIFFAALAIYELAAITNSTVEFADQLVQQIRIVQRHSHGDSGARIAYKTETIHDGRVGTRYQVLTNVDVELPQLDSPELQQERDEVGKLHATVTRELYMGLYKSSCFYVLHCVLLFASWLAFRSARRRTELLADMGAVVAGCGEGMLHLLMELQCDLGTRGKWRTAFHDHPPFCARIRAVKEDVRRLRSSPATSFRRTETR